MSSLPFSRRDFLKTSGRGLAGLALAGTLAKGGKVFAMDDPAKMIKIGVVGGGFGASFPWNDHPNCRVTAVSDLRPERLQHLVNTFQCDNAYPSLEELVKDKDIDAVAVFTEATNHFKHTMEVLKHGKHVISAVPAVYSSVEEAEIMLDAVKKSGLTYMMAETTYYMQHTISARKFYQEGAFGEVYYSEAEYLHGGDYNEPLYWLNGKVNGTKTWRFGSIPMHYPTHTTAHLISVTGERLTEVACHGTEYEKEMWDNQYGNRIGSESAMFKTNRGHGFRANIWWRGAFVSCERAQWNGRKMSFYTANSHGQGPVIVSLKEGLTQDDAGFTQSAATVEPYQQVPWWSTDLLPESLRVYSGHDGAHPFLTHEFVSALLEERRPTVDIYEALAYTVPGLVAHQSALKGGELLKIPQFD